MAAKKKRVFVSFDFDNDEWLRSSIVGQSRLQDSPFEMADWSMKEEAPQRHWEAEARAKIKRSDLVMVMVGPNTHKAPGVLKEVNMASEEGIRVVQIIGYSDQNHPRVPNAGTVYAWNWENLKKLLGG